MQVCKINTSFCYAYSFLIVAFSLIYTYPTFAQPASGAASMAGWVASGTPTRIGADQSITVVAGSEIAKTFSGSRVVLRLVSRPSFGETPQNWSTIEVGPASLTFLRDGTGGGIVLLGDIALQLPMAIPLGVDGRSALPIDLTFSLDLQRQSASVNVNGRQFSMAVTKGTGPVTIFISASRNLDWPISLIDVQAIQEATVTTLPSEGALTRTRDKSDAIGKATTPNLRAIERAQNFNEALLQSRSGNPTKADEALFKSNRYLSGTAGWHIESAGRLTQLALSLRQRYDARGAIAAARRALVLLQEAERLSFSAAPKQRATMHEMAGFLHEELLRDLASAKVSYQKAQQVDSQSKRAKRALEQLSAGELQAQRIAGAAQKGGGS